MLFAYSVCIAYIRNSHVQTFCLWKTLNSRKNQKRKKAFGKKKKVLCESNWYWRSSTLSSRLRTKQNVKQILKRGFLLFMQVPALIRKHQQSPRIVILGAVCWFVTCPSPHFPIFFIFASSISFAFGNFAHYCGVLPYHSTERSRQKTCLPWVTSAEKSLSIVIDARRSHFPISGPGSHYSQKQKLAHAKISKNLKPQTEVPKIWEHFQGRTTI